MSKAGTAIESPLFSSLDELRAACLDLPPGDLKTAAVATERQRQLTKPPGSLGRLEDVVVWLARWQGRSMPRLDRVDILVFAGNHGVTAQGVSAYPAAPRSTSLLGRSGQTSTSFRSRSNNLRQTSHKPWP